MPNGHDVLEKRVNDTEKQLASLTVSVKTTAESVEQLSLALSKVGDTMQTGFRRVDEQIETLGQRTSSQISSIATQMSDASKPQWQTLAAVIGVVIVLLGWFVRSELSPVQSRSDENTKALAEHHAQLQETRDMTIRMDERFQLWERGMLRVNP